MWVWDERRRLDKANPGWMQQDTITLRFTHVLTPHNVEVIFKRILSEARLDRSIREMISRALPGEPVLTRIDPVTQSATDPKERYAFVEASGIAMVSAGYGAEVLKAVDLLNPEDKRRPYILLIHAYAEYSLSRYLAATSHIAEVLLQWNSLSRENQMFADFLNDACDFHSGRIMMDDYLKRREAWSRKVTGSVALSQRLEILRHAIVEEESSEVRSSMLAEIRSIVTDLGKAADVDEASKLQARIILHYAEGQQYLVEFLNAAYRAQIRGDLQNAQILTVFVASQPDLLRSWERWEAESNDIMAEAISGGYPLLLADASAFTANVLSIYLVDCRIVSVGAGPVLEPPKALIDVGKNLAERALSIYQKAGSLEGELRAKMVLANLLEFDGDPDAALRLARDIVPLAKAMRYDGLEKQASDHVAGNSTLKRAIQGAADAAKQDPYSGWVSIRDTDIPEVARQMALARNLPVSQISIIEGQIRRLRDVATSRTTLCRYIALTDQGGRCRCARHGYEADAFHA